jgi:hypothetical protein
VRKVVFQARQQEGTEPPPGRIRALDQAAFQHRGEEILGHVLGGMTADAAAQQMGA